MDSRDHRNHSFDWEGFSFLCKILGVAAIAAVGVHFTLDWFRSPAPESKPPLAIAEERPVASASLSSTTPQRVINALSIEQAVPKEGKFIAADLVHMKLYLYENGSSTAEYPIYSKGRPGTPWETPSGFYSIATKEANHFSTIGHVYMPYSMQFYGNYFIHGMTYYPDGTPTAATFSGGCIKLETAYAQAVFEFADKGTRVFVYDSKGEPPAPLSLRQIQKPQVNAGSYLIADIDTGDVYAEQNASDRRPIASVTKLMTALVANETISLDKKVTVEAGMLLNPPDTTNTTSRSFLVNDLFYPLLMQSSNGVADALSSYYGTRGFVSWMNRTAQALDMTSTTFADASGISPENLSTTDDLFRLATYLANKKSFVLKITNAAEKTITAEDGTSYTIRNVNAPANTSPFEGGKVGHTTAAQDTLLSVVSFKVGAETRRAAIIVLGSPDEKKDASQLAEWITTAAIETPTQAACAACALPQYRKIQL
jgi:serine-type D-Ala-D-Ala endopeptidase (penicillin-binding protein 7)